MKNLFKNLMLVAVAAMAFTACTEEQNEVNAVKKETVLKFSTSFADTRVTIDNEKNGEGVYPVTWDGNEEVLFDIQDGGEYSWWDNRESNMTVDPNNSRNASFEVILDGYAAGATADMGSTIYAHFGKTTGRNSEYSAAIADQTQTPTLDGVDKSFISMVAEFPVEEEGQMVFNGTFEHKTAYGVITLPESVEDIAFKSVTIKVNNEKDYILNVEGLATHSYWFACEPDQVSVISVSAIDAEDAVYGYTATGLNKTFTAGVVSKFSISDLSTDVAEPVQLEMSEVTATVEGNIATFSWEDVANASSYAVSVNGADYNNIGKVNEYTLNLSAYEPFSSIYVYIKAVGTGQFLDSYSVEKRVVAPISKEADGEEGFKFVYTDVQTRGTNMYKFYNSNANEYMLLSFDINITTLEVGSYAFELEDEVNYCADSAFSHPLYDNNWNGVRDFWFQDNVAVYVDVLGNNNYTITAFCKRWVGDGNHLFKGTWNGTITPTLEAPQNLNATYSEGDVELTWDSVENAESYSITVGSTTFTSNVNNTGFYLGEEPGIYTISVIATAEGYNSSAAATTTVTIEDPNSGNEPGSGEQPTKTVVDHFDRFKVIPYGTMEVEVHFFLDEGTLNKVVLDFYIAEADGKLKTKNYSWNNAGFEQSYSYINGSSGEFIEDASIDVVVNGDGTYAFNGSIESTTRIFNINISGTSAFE